MEQTTTIISSIALFLIIVYYSLHGWRELRHEWRAVKRRLADPPSSLRHWRNVVLLIAFLLSGCVQAGPVIFYVLHLSEVFY